MLKVLTKFLSPIGYHNIRMTSSVLQSTRLYSQETNTAETSPETATHSEKNEVTRLEDEENDKLYKKVEIELRGHDSAVLNSYEWFAKTAAEHLNIEIGECWTPRKSEKERYTVLRSAFVHKKHRVQYEVRTYFKFLNFHRLTGSTLSTFLEYIERNLPEGVALKATKIEILELPEHLRQPPPAVTSEQTEDPDASK